MSKAHKHAEVIKAWADGKTIQLQNERNEWIDFDAVLHPGPWSEYNAVWRIKPEPKKGWVRVAEHKSAGGDWAETWADFEDRSEAEIEERDDFVRWLPPLRLRLSRRLRRWRMNLKEAKELNQGLQERSERIEHLLFRAMRESGVILEHHPDSEVNGLASKTEVRIVEAIASVRELMQFAREQEQLIKDQSKQEEEKALQAAIALVKSSGLVVAKKEAQRAQKKASWWNIKRWRK